MREVPISYLFSDNHSDWREVIDILFRLWQVYTLLEEDCLGACVCVSEKAMAPHSSTLAWKIPRTEEPGGLQSMGPLRVGHN